MRIKDIYNYMLHSNDDILKEANLNNLLKKSTNETPKLAQRGQQLYNRVRYFGLSKDGTLNFKVGSQSEPGHFYYIYIEAPDILRFGDIVEEGDHFTKADLAKLLTMNGFRIHCSDPSFLYYAFQYMATQGNYEVEPETRAPKRNNTLLKGGLCKHLCATVANIYNNDSMREQISKDIDNYLRMLSGLDYDDYQQANHAKQIQQQNRAVKWKTKPSDYMNDYFARQAKHHPFLDDHDIKKSLKKEITKFARTNPTGTTDDFLRSYFQMTQKAFAEDMKIPESSVEDYFNELGLKDKQEKQLTKLEQKQQRTKQKDEPIDTSKTQDITKSNILTKDSEQPKHFTFTMEKKLKYKKEIEHIYPDYFNRNNISLDTVSDERLTSLYNSAMNKYIKSEEFQKEIEQDKKNKDDEAKRRYDPTYYIEDSQTRISLHKDQLIESNEAKEYFTPAEAHEKYQEYLKGHIQNVNDALELIIRTRKDNQFIQDEQEVLRNICKQHDISKYCSDEYEPYLHHFYPTCPDHERETEAFELACRHHIRNNKHHWDFWLNEDTGELNVPDEREYKLYCVERVCDWLAMAKQHNEYKTDWWDANKDAIKLTDYGRELIEDLFKHIPDDFYLNLHFDGTRGKLDEQEISTDDNTLIESSITSELDDLYQQYKDILAYPIETFRTRVYSDDKNSKYVINYHARIKPNIDIYTQDLNDIKDHLLRCSNEKQEDLK